MGGTWEKGVLKPPVLIPELSHLSDQQNALHPRFNYASPKRGIKIIYEDRGFSPRLVVYWPEKGAGTPAPVQEAALLGFSNRVLPPSRRRRSTPYGQDGAARIAHHLIGCGPWQVGVCADVPLMM